VRATGEPLTQKLASAFLYIAQISGNLMGRITNLSPKQRAHAHTSIISINLATIPTQSLTCQDWVSVKPLLSQSLLISVTPRSYPLSVQFWRESARENFRHDGAFEIANQTEALRDQT
jgi:hypothetical protein